MHYQRKKSAGTINTEEERAVKELLQNTQRLLQPTSVRNPFAEQLQIPSEVFKPRRTNAHYLQFIEAVTFYHQYQREKHTDKASGETYINTTLEDIEEANRLMKEVLLRKADELSGATRNYFEQLKQTLQQTGQSTFTNKEVKQLLRLPISTVKRHNLELLQAGYIKRGERKKTKAYQFEITSYEEYLQLGNSIATVLDNVYSSLAAHEPTMAQTGGEPIRSRRSKALPISAQ